MRKAIAICAIFAVAGSLALRAIAAERAADKAADEKPKYTIKDVMKDAHKGKDSLVKKVAAGKASADEKKMLLELYQELAKNEPPQGEAASWKEKTAALVAAAQAVIDDDAQGGKKLTAASNCGACHKIHKPK